MHDIDLIDPPPTDLETTRGESRETPAPAESPGPADADALLALLRLLDTTRDDSDACLAVWCADPLTRDAALVARTASETTFFETLGASSADAHADDETWFGDAARGPCPGPSATTDRDRRQRRRSRR